MALWTFAEVTRDVRAGQDADAAKREFDDDLWVQRRRVMPQFLMSSSTARWMRRAS